jgi:hypothetical protein
MKINYRGYLRFFTVLGATIVAPIHLHAAASQPVYVSCLVPKGQGCVWLKIGLPDGKKETLAEFPCPNYGARVSWKSGLKEALVWFNPGTGLDSNNGDETDPAPGYPSEEFPEFKDRLYKVNLKNGNLQTVPLLETENHSEMDYGYTAKGEMAAFDTVEPAPEDRHLLEGIDNAIARAFRLRKGKWTVFERKGTAVEMCDAAGIGVLDALHHAGPGTADLLQVSVEGDDANDKATLRRLKKFEPKSDPSDDWFWTKISTPFGSAYCHNGRAEGIAIWTTGLILLENKGQLFSPTDEGFTARDTVAVQVRGPYLLVTSPVAGCHPRIYDLRTGELAFKSNTARATVFWPDEKKTKGDE